MPGTDKLYAVPIASTKSPPAVMNQVNPEISDNFPIINEPQEHVNHPSHYQSDSGIEVIDVIEAFTKGLDGIEAFDAGNAIKYICRWKHKNGIEDLRKARWYIDNLINYLYEKEINS